MLTLRKFDKLSSWDKELSNFFNWPTPNGYGSSFTPSVDIEELEDKILIQADLPGLKEKDISITVKDNKLILSGKKEKTKEAKNYTYYERSYGSFFRQFHLNELVDSEKIAANFENGVLTISLPKKEEIKPKQIPISTS